jgi:hypothetical protein
LENFQLMGEKNRQGAVGSVLDMLDFVLVALAGLLAVVSLAIPLHALFFG